MAFIMSANNNLLHNVFILIYHFDTSHGYMIVLATLLTTLIVYILWSTETLTYM